MKQDAFAKVCRETPLIMPEFRIVKLEKWVETYGYKKGDLVLYHPNGVFLSADKSRECISPYASHVEFVGYVKVKFNRETGTKTVEAL